MIEPYTNSHMPSDRYALDHSPERITRTGHGHPTTIESDVEYIEQHIGKDIADGFNLDDIASVVSDTLPVFSIGSMGLNQQQKNANTILGDIDIIKYDISVWEKSKWDGLGQFENGILQILEKDLGQQM
jgi:hypothetical protein